MTLKRFKIGMSASMLVLLLLSSCSDDGITYYEIPKEPASVNDMMLPDGHPQVGAASTQFGSTTQQAESALGWQVPDGWADGKPSSVRLGSYVVADMAGDSPDISVTRFPGDVGGLFSNVNRWRRQLGMESMGDPSELGSVPVLDTGRFEFQIVDLVTNADPAMATRVAILEVDGFSWFFKITGTKEAVDAEHDRFEQFIRSVERGDAES